MARLKYTLIVVNPETFESHALIRGTEPPKWADVDEGNFMSAEEEKAFINERLGDLAVNEDSDKDDAAPDGEKSYADMTVSELTELIEARNQQRQGNDSGAEQIVPPSGRKADLVASLEADDLVNGGE